MVFCTIDCDVSVLRHLGHMKLCSIVERPTSMDENHSDSTLHDRQIGASKSETDRLSLSTIFTCSVIEHPS